MISAISNMITSPTMVNIAQSTRTAMSIETALKATGRPTFILMDNDISPETKKYAAAKELLYQLTCLAVYMLVVLPIFRKQGFKLFQKHFKNNAHFQKFANLNEFSQYYKLHELKRKEIAEALNNPKLSGDIKTKAVRDELANMTKAKREALAESNHLVKGADEVSSIIGSVAGLAILAPEVSHLTIHPIMKWLGLNEGSKKSEEPQTELKMK